MLEPDELSLLLRFAEPFENLYALAYLTASRLSEVRELHASALHASELHIPQSKQHREKRLYLTPLLRSLTAKLPATGPLFPSPINDALPVSRSAVHKHLSLLAAECDLSGTTTHSFRRSRATHCYRQGIKPLSIMALTGHSDLKTFLNYIDIKAEEIAEQTATMDDLLFPFGI